MPAGTPKYFSYPFGINGDLASVPDLTQPAGSISYQQGYGPNYQLVNTNPASLTIPRTNFNQVLFDITSTLQQLYQNGFPLFITSAMNDSVAFSYSKNAYVYQPSDGNVYYSLLNSNTDVPPSVKWQLANNTSLYFNAATDTGTANHYSVAPTPALLAYAAGIIVTLQPGAANTGACDLNVSGLGIKNIKTLLNQDPLAGMIIPTGTYLFSYNAVTGCMVLLNPTLGTAAYVSTGTTTGTIPVLTSTGLPAVSGQNLTNLPAQYTEIAAASGKIVFGAITFQWGVTAVASPATVTFGTAFSGQPFFVGWTGISPTGGGTNFTTGTQPYTHGITSAGFSVLGGTSGQPPYNWLAIGPT